jgi:hypothetical protein
VRRCSSSRWVSIICGSSGASGRRKGGLSMQDIRKVLYWIFACTSLMFIVLSLRSMYAVSRRDALLTPRNLFIFVLFKVVVATVTGVAGWSILKGKPSRSWGIAASLMYVLIFVWPIIFSLQSVWPHHLGALFVGIVGLVELLWRGEHPDPSQNPKQSTDSGLGGPVVDGPEP